MERGDSLLQGGAGRSGFPTPGRRLLHLAPLATPSELVGRGLAKWAPGDPSMQGATLDVPTGPKQSALHMRPPNHGGRDEEEDEMEHWNQMFDKLLGQSDDEMNIAEAEEEPMPDGVDTADFDNEDMNRALEDMIALYVAEITVQQKKAETSTPIEFLPDRPSALEKRLAIDREGRGSFVSMPKDWARRLSARDLARVYRGQGSRVFLAACEGSQDCSIAIKVASTDGKETQNEIDMLRKLRFSGNVVALLASQEVSERSFLLMEAADTNLKEFWSTARDGPMPLSESLPILIDLLRGARDVGQAGIVHAAISEENILMKGGRPLFSDFGAAAVVSETDRAFGTRSAHRIPGISQYSLPPETIRGLPTGTSNNVWQVGAVFAKMCLGYIPMESFVKRVSPDLAEREWEPEVDDLVQDLVRQKFSVAQDAGVAALEDDAKRLIEGMLQTTPESRWGAVGALQEAIAIAERQGIEVPPERAPFELPVPWSSDWE